MCISNKYPGEDDADAVSLRPYFQSLGEESSRQSEELRVKDLTEEL